ncbi:MAG TPA: PQQ-binding-like beta-propeller repeat protein [Alphaproteobacteria bacterium]|nr:PQQ-binding-like beta-propeller repeat protein [Alphaproteobacteria bacterium]
MKRLCTPVGIVGFALLAACANPQKTEQAQAGGPPDDQVKRAELVYADRCAACHGANLEGKSALDLAGSGAFSRWAGQSAADLYQRVLTMPYGAAGSLSKQQYADLTALILVRNGTKLSGEIAPDPSALRQIAIGRTPPAPTARLVTMRDITDKIAGGPSQAELSAANGKTTDWLTTTHGYAGQRFVDLKQINTSNVSSLRPVCMYQVGDMNPFPTNPIVYKGAMFITSRNAVVSLDAATCKVNWRYDRPSRVAASYSLKMNRGGAIKDGKFVYGTHDGFLIALDAGTGKVIWERDVANANQNEGGFTSAPLIYDDLVIASPSGSELGVKGWIGAFRLSTGEPVWRFNTVPDDNEPGADTWPSHDARQHGGGAVWGSLTFDPATGLLYVPVSNPTPDFDGDKRLGANLYTCSMVVLDIRTGKLVWYYQISPHDTHDYDLTQASPQFDATIGGKLRHLVVAAGKEGTVHVLDRDTHEHLYEVPVTTRTHTDVPLIGPDMTKEGVMPCPGLIGGIEWNGPAFNPITKMLYVPAVDWCAISKEPPEKSKGWVTAIDATTGTVAWRYKSQRPVVAAVTTTSADLVFAGELTGNLIALDARTGKPLYRFDMGGPISGGIATYEVGGRQYVAATSGNVNNFWQAAPGSSTVVVFALP